ncbi:hypothetical protein JCM19240_4992 [Vibrio maritimus]|uniref:Uncharacterized protein n=1 Tax=Vibrio maritimus TaxID=990268 RepID=A0A090SV55_9VIBR|nr:hypothetical protein JCM19240_4992 [Vibrio maritimus]
MSFCHRDGDTISRDESLDFEVVCMYQWKQVCGESSCSLEIER